MTFRETIENDLVDTFFDTSEFAVTATFLSPFAPGGSVECCVLVDHNSMVQAEGYETGVVTVGTTIEALFSDVGKPKKGDTFTIDGTTYIVKDVESCDKVTTKSVVVEKGY